ncbi:MAG: DinB family protein [Vicinamibacterales bacterium]
MTLDEARDLYAYDVWANARTFNAVAALPAEVADAPVGGSFLSIRATIAHLVASEWVWLRRWLGDSPSQPPEWTTAADVAGLRLALTAIEAERLAYLSHLTATDLTRILSYRTLAGEPHADPLAGLLRHVVNHSAYHRGQVTTLLRQTGHPAVDTDLVTYLRLPKAAAGTL